MRADRDDLINETFCKMRPSDSRFEQRNLREVIAYAKHIVRNLLKRNGRDRVRRARREVQWVHLCIDPVCPPEELLLAAERTRAMSEALASLPQSLREVLVLCDLEGLGIREAATQLAIPEGTVKSRRRRALRLCMRALEALGLCG